MPVAITTDLAVDGLPGGVFNFVAKGVAIPKQIRIGTVELVDHNKVNEVTMIDHNAVGVVSLINQYKIGDVEFVC